MRSSRPRSYSLSSRQRSHAVAFRNIISNGLVLDKNGNKMSKRLGNGVDPFEVLATYGQQRIMISS